jgi:hypothetical protein
MLVTSRLNAVSVDVQQRTARVAAGARWQHVLDAATPHGLAPLLGTSPHVGVVGYTVGGGIGWLGRLYGLAADSVLSIDVVTPDGELRRTSATENLDLFWAIRGGGGNFGVITAMEFKLYPVPTLYGGILTYPGALAGEVLRFYREWVKGVPDEITSSLAVMKFPNVPPVPEAMRGQIVVLVRAAYAGTEAAGAPWLQPWLAWQEPLSNSFKEMPFGEVATINNDPVAPVPSYPSSDMLTELSDAVIDIIVRYATNPASPVAFSEVRHAGGAIARGDANASAIGNRDATFYLQIGGLALTPELGRALDRYVPEYKAALQPYLHGGIYLNFAGGREASARVKDAYAPESYARLVKIKREVDPQNLFRYSFPLVETA